MKKILFFTVAAATVMALTGCSQSSDLTETAETSQTAISFDTYLAKTRAGATGSETTETLKTNGFGVLAYYTAQDNYVLDKFIPDFMYNTKVTGTKTSWEYSPVRYWPNADGDKISFFAYAPYVDVDVTQTSSNGNATDITSGIVALSPNNSLKAPYVQYKLSSDFTSTNSVDLLWGVKKSDNAAMNTDLKKSTNSVGFTFKHALAKWDGANFLQAKIATDDQKFDPTKTKITIESISISSSALAASGKFDLTKGTWSNQATDDKTKLSINISKDQMNPDVAEKNYSAITITSTTDWDNIKGLSTTQSNVCKDNTISSFYFIPVTTTTQASVTVTYWTRTLDPNLKNGCTNVKQTVTKDIQLPAFAANKKYTLVLSIGLNTINFSAEVSDWTSDTDNTATTTIALPEVAK